MVIFVNRYKSNSIFQIKSCSSRLNQFAFAWFSKTMLASTLSKSLIHSLVKLLPTTARRAATTASYNNNSFPHIVNVTPEEKSCGALTWKNLELANRALHHDGLVVLENAISHSKLDILNQKMVQDALELQSAGENSPYNYNKGYSFSIPKQIKRQELMKVCEETYNKTLQWCANILKRRFSSTRSQFKSHRQSWVLDRDSRSCRATVLCLQPLTVHHKHNLRTAMLTSCILLHPSRW